MTNIKNLELKNSVRTTVFNSILHIYNSDKYLGLALQD